MNATDALFDVHWVPRQVEIEQHTGVLQIDTFPTGSRADHHSRAPRLLESLFGSQLAAMVAPFEHHHALARIRLVDLLAEHLDRTQVGGEDHDTLGWVVFPQCSQSVDQLLHLGFSLLRVACQQVPGCAGVLPVGTARLP